MQNNKIINGNCWVACFDIIGFKNLLNDFMGENKTNKGVAPALDAFVQNYYKDILRKLAAKGKYWPDKIFVHWFSDTFLLYTFDGSAESLCCIEVSATNFFVDVLGMHMPLRGALSIGALYADKKSGIFLGPGLIDAYQYAEKQDWIGLVITPTARSELQKINLCPPERGKYVEYDVPIKKGPVEKLFAYKLEIIISGENTFLKDISRMQLEAKQQYPAEYGTKYRSKYENTLKFIEWLQRRNN